MRFRLTHLFLLVALVAILSLGASQYFNRHRLIVHDRDFHTGDTDFRFQLIEKYAGSSRTAIIVVGRSKYGDHHPIFPTRDGLVYRSRDGDVHLRESTVAFRERKLILVCCDGGDLFEIGSTEFSELSSLKHCFQGARTYGIKDVSEVAKRFGVWENVTLSAINSTDAGVESGSKGADPN